jgi:hypothetical protein
MDLGEIRSHVFRAEAVYYDLSKRNQLVLGQ